MGKSKEKKREKASIRRRGRRRRRRRRKKKKKKEKKKRGSKGKSHRGLAGHDQRATLAKQHYEALEEDRLIVSFACLLKERQKIKYDECGVTNKGNK